MSTNNIPEYLPGGKHVSSSIGRFVNYIGPAPDAYSALRECESLTGEDCTIINGSDDWNSPKSLRPQSFVPREMVVAWFHTGISGITRSGCVVRSKDVDQIKKDYESNFTLVNWSRLKVISLR